jgi:hypothetical protein
MHGDSNIKSTALFNEQWSCTVKPNIVQQAYLYMNSPVFTVSISCMRRILNPQKPINKCSQVLTVFTDQPVLISHGTAPNTCV